MNIGFLGCSKIGKQIVKALKSIENVTLYGCSARDYEKAKQYKEEFGFIKAYKSYEEMVKDPEIELVYVSTLISSHFNDTLLALKHNKPCIVEKSFTANAKEAKELCFYSEKHNIYLTEAIWTRYMESRRIISDILKEKIIGDIYHVEANLSYPINNVERIITPNQGGGVTRDLGVYPINFLTMFFGYDFEILNSILTIDKMHNIDESMLVNVVYKNGLTATLYSSILGTTSKKGIIYGTKGYIEVDNINNPLNILVYKLDENRIQKLIKNITINEPVNGYEYEFIEAIQNILDMQIESNSMLHYDTIKVMEIVDTILEKSLKVEK